MKIDFSKIDTERFHLNERSIPGLGDFILLVPHKAMWDWTPGEEHLRSLMCRPDGTVVSSGFPKFFNFGEKPEHDALTTQGLQSGKTLFTAKADGSLIIRSVIDGKVHFRTRGCDQIASDMKPAVETLINDRYPKLLDPSGDPPNASFLMEYVAPANQIVVRYDEAKLVGLGWVEFGGERLSFLGGHASMVHAGVEPIWTMDLPRDIVQLKQAVASFNDQEGIVTWTSLPDGTIHMSKFKSAWYLRLHSLRSQATPRYLKEFCYFNGIETLDQLKDAFYKEGFDWEVVSYVEPMFDELETHMGDVEAIQAGVNLMMEDEGVLSLPTRKDKALAVKDLIARRNIPEGWFGYMMSRAIGENTDDHIGAMKMEMGLAAFRSFKKTGPEKLGSGKVIDDG